MYAESVQLLHSSPFNATLQSPDIQPGELRCLRFAFIFGGNSPAALSVYGLLHGEEERQIVWKVNNVGPKSKAWKETEVTMPLQVYSFQFVAKQDGKYGIGIDDVLIIPGQCTGNKCVYTVVIYKLY